MSLLPALLRTIDEALALQGRGLEFDVSTPLLGAVPEFDSMGAMALLTALESELGVTFDFGELGAETFATVGTLLDHLEQLRGDT